MNDTVNIIKVGIADMNVVQSPSLIRTSGLGSCVGVVIYDTQKEIAGLVHVMLPDSSLAKADSINIAKYADTGIEELINRLTKIGARVTNLKAKIAGGAQMFQFSTQNEMMRIGPRNVEAVKKELQRFRIPIIAEDVGGSSGRTIEFNPSTRKLNIRTVNQGVKDI
ncbi:chemotaxis protein CheD [Schinkia azotoformans]|uniref:Probable chemoreceptor glutamine deamidase CheD n=1 Tax=Schinkia azotoformans LMG 9581 TaxID=1131731 RepID=K6CUI2_SCHAZ|nr:chemotaxis protein CheD [Schinkia azotoformans]EKN63907.1 chemotaxis protein, stimulates methylation of MCP proteins by cheR [Schinkia azotoformans LMG 9581]MEC1638229.1 chemotaxis protein CheD [Schinkia azotoformans]MEC1721883.1 chemotaxis protein CheD [Schinkia azotoformans]MEC1946337.1 chemotaxis protein CheD [Schinkia azotoformans]MED4411637.1 chemotaxis protein CheD [Schinkia azotoformans]